MAAVYLQALVFEQAIRTKTLSPRTLAKYRQNPALMAEDYSMELAHILDYARWMGWVEKEDLVLAGD